MGHVIGAEKGTGQEFLPQRNRIPRQVASFKGPARARTSHHSAAVGRIFLGQVGIKRSTNIENIEDLEMCSESLDSEKVSYGPCAHQESCESLAAMAKFLVIRFDPTVKLAPFRCVGVQPL